MAIQPVNWQKTRDLVKKTVDRYGRPISLEQEQGPVDADKPLGPQKPPVRVDGVMGVFVRPSGYIKLGESFYLDPGMWEEAEKIVLVLPSLEYDFSKFTRVIDEDNIGFKIFKVEQIKPGPVPLLLYLGLKS